MLCILECASHTADDMCASHTTSVTTLNGESFTGLNFHGFDPIKYLAEKLSRFIAIGQEYKVNYSSCKIFTEKRLRSSSIP